MPTINMSVLRNYAPNEASQAAIQQLAAVLLINMALMVSTLHHRDFGLLDHVKLKKILKVYPPPFSIKIQNL